MGVLSDLASIACANPGVKYLKFSRLPFLMFDYQEESTDQFNDITGFGKLRLRKARAFRTNELPFANIFESFSQHHLLLFEVEAMESICIRYCPGISRNSIVANFPLQSLLWQPFLNGIDACLMTEFQMRKGQRMFLMVEWGLNDILCIPPLAKRASLLLSFLTKSEWTYVKHTYVISGSRKLDRPLLASARIATQIDCALAKLGDAAILSSILEAISTAKAGHVYSLQPHHFTFQRFPSLEDHNLWGCLNCQQMTRLALLATRDRLGKLRQETAVRSARTPISPLWPSSPLSECKPQYS